MNTWMINGKFIETSLAEREGCYSHLNMKMLMIQIIKI